MQKDFDSWNELKKRINDGGKKAYAHPREVWWCSLGVNVGAEIDGKNDTFERPVLVLRVYNKDTLLILPITTREKNDKFHYKTNGKSGDIWIKLTQTRVISSQRLLRKVDVLSTADFEQIKKCLQDYL